jgi:hypothetical protein
MSQKTEAEAIEGAYQEKLGSLFDSLVRTMMEWSNDAKGEQRSVEQFTRGLKFARRARELALTAVGAPPSVAATSAEDKRA